MISLRYVALQRARVARHADQRLKRSRAALEARAALKLQRWEACGCCFEAFIDILL